MSQLSTDDREIFRSDLLFKPEMLLLPWHVLLCSKWLFWCCVRVCIPASAAAGVCVTCYLCNLCNLCNLCVTRAAAMVVSGPFQAHTVDSEKIPKVSEYRARQYPRPCYS